MMISVIMPVYNEKLYELKDSIKSILNQSYSDFEFIIIDDNPKSGIIKNFLLKESKRDNRIKVYFNKTNLGPMLSANKAIKLAHGVYIARMDADDISYKDRLEKQLQFCIKRHLVFSSCNFSFIQNNIKQYFVYGRSCCNTQKIKKILYHINIATGPTLFFNRQVIKDIGGYRNILAEDYDLAMRVLINGYKFGYLSVPLVYKRSRQNSLSGIKSLDTFIIMYLIKKHVKRTNFTKKLPIRYIVTKKKSIKSYNIKYYHKFIYYLSKYNHMHRFIYLLEKYFWGCSTIFMFKRSLHVFTTNKLHSLFRYFYNIKKVYK